MYELLMLLSVGGVLGLGAGLRALLNRNQPEAFAHRRAIRKLRASPIADVPERAKVRIDGAIVEGEGELLSAPLTGRPCVYYIAVVQEQIAGTGGGESSWRELGREIGSVPFIIEDGTGRAVIDPTRAKIDAELDLKSRSGFLDAPTSSEAAFLARRGFPTTGRGSAKPMRYIEGMLEVGDRVAVVGRAVYEPDPAAAALEIGYREAARHRLRLAGAEREPLLVSNARSVTQPGHD